MGTHRPRLRRSPRRPLSNDFLQSLEPRELLATINVADYGANPNDGNDDRSAIVNAINHSNDGDTIYFPAATVSGGTYRISQEISGNTGGVTKSLGRGRIYKGETTFVTNGDGTFSVQDRSILESTGPGEESAKSNAIFFFGEGNPNPNTFNVKFTNLTFKGRGLRISRPNNAMAEGMIIDNNHFDTRGGTYYYNNGVEWSTGLRDSQVTNNLFYCGGNNGVSGYNWDHVLIANNWFINPVGLPAGNEGIHMHAFLRSSANLTIEQNYFSNLRRMGIEYQYGGVNTLVQDNWYENPFDGNNTDQFAYSIVADEGQDTITRRNTAIMPIRHSGDTNYVRIIFELGGKNLLAEDNYTYGGNDPAPVNGSHSTGLVRNNHFEQYWHVSTGAVAAHNNNGSTANVGNSGNNYNNNVPTYITSFNPDGRIAGSSAPIRYRPLTNHRYSDPDLPPPPSDNKPAAPASLTATPVTPSQISLNWSDQASNEDGYRIEMSTDNVNFQTVDTLSANSTTDVISGLTETTLYYFRVIAFNSLINGGDSAPSNIASSKPLDSGIPATPTNLVGTTFGLNRVDLTWTDNATNETEYRIERLSEDGTTWIRMDTLAANATSYSMTSLASGKTFSFRVIAYNGNMDKTSNPANTSVQTPVADLTSTVPPPAPKRTRPAFFFGGASTGAVSPPVTASA